MDYIITSLKTYNNYISRYNTNNLSKKLKLHVSNIPNDLKINEIFNNELNLIEDIDFNIEKYKNFKYSDENNYIYYFELKNIKYRLDFVIIKEINENLTNKRLHNKKFISISFSLKESGIENYDIPTRLNNQYDVMNYIIFLINDFKNKINNDYIFMFGDPNDDRKVNIYKFIIKQCFSDYEIIKDYTSGFSNSNIGYYLCKN